MCDNFNMAYEKRHSRSLFTFCLGNRLSKLLKSFAHHWEGTLYLTEHGKSRSKDLKLEILIWKTTFVQVHRESSTERNRSTKIRLGREKNLVSDLYNKILNLEKKEKEFICTFNIYISGIYGRVNQTAKFDLS